ncbi:HNH endonuclease, partial [Mycolicibacterium sp. P1-18]|uniref:HNH endonuclease signature motif containing protein n=1 Tax=Mycolicibacterium sp. P1-18 TaxID=2024615 RepID=UPI0011F1B48D
GPRTALNGQPLDPKLAPTAAAQGTGAIGPEHVTEIRSFLDKLPGWVDPDVVALSEQTLVHIGSGTGPDELRQAAKTLATAIDQDGPKPDDVERARKRFLRLGPQQADGMSRITGLLDPEARATIEPILAKYAAPGMCNPEDCKPRTSGTPSQEQIDTDTRTFGQRTHDALIAVARNLLSSGELGQHNGLPVTIIVTTTLQDLEAARGSGVTGGGSLLPMADLIRMASHAHHYLAVFDKHTSEALYLGRSKRLASVGQRIVLHARDRGCTKPGCTVPGYGSQVHHTTGWAKNGQTNIDEVTFACGGDNRLAEHGWTVQLRDGVVEWLPPPQLDVGQARVNYLHHPERLLAELGPRSVEQPFDQRQLSRAHPGRIGLLWRAEHLQRVEACRGQFRGRQWFVEQRNVDGNVKPAVVEGDVAGDFTRPPEAAPRVRRHPEQDLLAGADEPRPVVVGDAPRRLRRTGRPHRLDVGQAGVALDHPGPQGLEGDGAVHRTVRPDRVRSGCPRPS